jgi:hypothetical protein
MSTFVLTRSLLNPLFRLGVIEGETIANFKTEKATTTRGKNHAEESAKSISTYSMVET